MRFSKVQVGGDFSGSIHLLYGPYCSPFVSLGVLQAIATILTKSCRLSNLILSF